MARSNLRQAPRPPVRTEAAREDDREILRAPEGVTRKRKGNVDQFELPERQIKRFLEAGWSLEWKKHTVVGQPDASYEVMLGENGWEPVTSDELPAFMPKGFSGAIIRDGLQLMKRPKYLTEEARREDSRAAQDVIRRQHERLKTAPPGTMTRDHPEARPKVNKAFEPIDIPSDEE